MQNHSPVTSRFWLNATIVAGRLEAHHLSHGDFADSLGLSRSYWSQLIHRKRTLTPQIRRCLLTSGPLAGVPENERCDVLARAAITSRR